MLVLHGWGSDSTRWHKVTDILSVANIQVIIPDLPGFGQSAKPTDSWKLDTYVEWLCEFSENVPELKDGFYLLGHSFGGSLAAKFSIKYNQKVKKLFLISAACVRQVTLWKKILHRISKIVKVFSFLPYYDKARKGFYKFVIRKSDYPYMQGVMKDTYLNVVSDNLSHKLLFVKVPTVIIWGDKDTFTPLYQAEIIHKKITGSKLIIIPGADHALQIHFPEILSQKILENL